MPGFDKTGPEGKGSKTGRGLGTCSDNKSQEKYETDDFKRSRGGLRRRFRICRRNEGGMRNKHSNSGGKNNNSYLLRG